MARATFAVQLLSSSDALGSNVSSCAEHMVFRVTGDTTSCVCDAGYTGPACTPCVPGTFKNLASTFLPCSACPAFSTSLAASTHPDDCLCLAGYTPGDGCQPCSEGTYKVAIGNTECSKCPNNTYSQSNSDAITDCECVSGYQSSDEGCVPCAAGFSSEGNKTFCTPCGSNSYQPLEGQPACIDCPPHTINAGDGVTCHCVPGYFLNMGVCVPCTPGSAKAEAGNQSCAPCDNVSYATAGSEVCQACPPNTTVRPPAQSVQDCQCNPGFESGENGLCVSCQTGKYWNYSLEICAACPKNTYQDKTAQLQCKSCASNSVSPAGSRSAANCLCKPGFRKNAFECLPCSQGFISDEYDSAVCQVCPDNYYWVNSTYCEQCPAFSSSYGAHIKSNVDACLCTSGFERLNSSCVPCQANFTCAGRNAKTPCFSNSVSAPGSFNTSNCTCLPGSWLSSDSVCDACPENHYCMNNSKIPCAPHSSAPNYSYSVQQCTCNAGFALLTFI